MQASFDFLGQVPEYISKKTHICVCAVLLQGHLWWEEQLALFVLEGGQELQHLVQEEIQESIARQSSLQQFASELLEALDK